MKFTQIAFQFAAHFQFCMHIQIGDVSSTRETLCHHSNSPNSGLHRILINCMVAS